MTRQQYINLVLQQTSIELYFINDVSIPTLINEVAIDLFIACDFESPLAIETRKQLTQLRDLGTHSLK